jgi:hypothetical protein
VKLFLKNESRIFTVGVLESKEIKTIRNHPVMFIGGPYVHITHTKD